MYVPSWPAMSPLLPLHPQSTCALPFPFRAPHKTYAYLARGLIYHLFRALKLGDGAVVLAPNYHHGNEIRAIRATGANIRFYRIDRRLEPDLDEIRALITPEVKALFAIHYNGWAQPVDELAALCRERGIVFVEDCALSMFAEHHGRPLGSFGDYGIFCLYKWLPVPHGGLLVQNGEPLPAIDALQFRECDRTSVAGRSLELMLEAVQTEFEWLGRSLFAVKHAVGELMTIARLERTRVGDTGFDRARARLGMSPITRHILERIDYDGIAEKRRMLYSLLWTRLVGHVTLLDKELEAGVCPLFFPMLVADKRLAVETLRQHGVGAVELWNHGDPGVDPERSQDAKFLRDHVIELPIHQDMTPDQIDHMARVVKELRPMTTMIEVARRPTKLALARPAAIEAATDYSVETIEGPAPEVIDKLAPEWTAICDEGPCDELFHRPEWLRAFMRAFEPESKLVISAVRAGGKLRAVLPLIEDHAMLFGMPVHRLRSPMSSHSCRFDLIHGAGDAERCAHAIWRHLKELPRWDVIELRDVADGSTMRRIADLAEGERWPVGHWESIRSPYVTLPRAGRLDQNMPLGTTDAKFRANLRRRLRKLEALGQVTMRVIEHDDPEVLRTFYALERSGWKGDVGSAIECNPATRQFYDELARAAARTGRLSIYQLELDGRPIAMQLGTRSRDRYFIHKPAYDESFAAMSPGQILMDKVLRDCANRGLVELDFLGASMPWKRDWTNAERRHEFCFLFHKGAYGSLLHATKFRLVPFAKNRILPHAPVLLAAKIHS